MTSHRGSIADIFGERKYVDVVGFKEVLYDSGCMGSGVIMLINDTTWLLLEKW